MNRDYILLGLMLLLTAAEMKGGYETLTYLDKNPEFTCHDMRMLNRDTVLCKAQFPQWVMLGGVFFPTPDGYNYVFYTDQPGALKHELCHLAQHKEGRTLDEIECYIKGWVGMWQ